MELVKTRCSAPPPLCLSVKHQNALTNILARLIISVSCSCLVCVVTLLFCFRSHSFLIHFVQKSFRMRIQKVDDIFELDAYQLVVLAFNEFLIFTMLSNVVGVFFFIVPASGNCSSANCWFAYLAEIF